MVDPEVIVWAFRMILGREPEDEFTIRHLAEHGHSIAQVRSAVMASPEFQQLLGTAVLSPGRFEASSRAGPRIVILSNCQGPEIARHLASVTGVQVVGREILQYDPAHPDPFLQDLETADWIISIPLSDDYQGIRLDDLRTRFPGKVLSMNGIYFQGLHPDIVMLGSRAERVSAPMDMHSALIAHSFAWGVAEADCLALFCGATYEALGYYAMWALSQEEFLRREATVDLSIADDFFAAVHAAPLLLTMSHPTSRCFRLIVARICRALDLPFRDIPSEGLATMQAFNPTWPVYDEIAERHGLAYRTTQTFVREHESWDLQGFIRRSYAHYERFGRETMLRHIAERGAGYKVAHPWMDSAPVEAPARARRRLEAPPCVGAPTPPSREGVLQAVPA